ncbi:YihY/virulence factor BrkB family protein, partial [Pseudomonas juntendi]
GFAYYVKTFADYNAMYGSIGAIIVLLLYFYISAAVLLLGAEMNAVIEHMSAEGKNPGEKDFDEHAPAQTISVLGHEHPTSGQAQTSEPNPR